MDIGGDRSHQCQDKEPPHKAWRVPPKVQHPETKILEYTTKMSQATETQRAKEAPGGTSPCMACTSKRLKIRLIWTQEQHGGLDHGGTGTKPDRTPDPDCVEDAPKAVQYLSAGCKILGAKAHFNQHTQVVRVPCRNIWSE
ncbi:hypothetical protein CHARACLAT_019243 [Characodon lateralis]|uniref:Uncharacterized protein n=1 Tax=Characodon lateralis TaxID=208331 RepID=A0ABU7D0W1_9TELE|nr:hypothetical protein [Characodon lateralis]